jgi:hypothetical protein
MKSIRIARFSLIDGILHPRVFCILLDNRTRKPPTTTSSFIPGRGDALGKPGHVEE